MHLPIVFRVLFVFVFAAAASTLGTASAQDANFYACNNGYATCNQGMLSEEQKAQVSQAALQRNFYACNNGYATCNQTLLSESQRSQVNQSALQRNFHACNNGYATCNQTLLSDDQLKQITTKASSQTKLPSDRQAPISPSYCAENGSCYGDISGITGLPKTHHVNGYYRKDGTYVRGHFRSRR